MRIAGTHKRNLLVVTLVTSALLAVGCGDDGGRRPRSDGAVADAGNGDGAVGVDAPTFTGLGAELLGDWLLQSWSQGADGGGVTVLSSTTTPPSVRAALRFVPAGDNLSLSLYFGMLENGVPTGLPETDTLPVVAEDAEHVLIDGTVFNHTVIAGELTLTPDETDPRNIPLHADVPMEIVARRFDVASYPIIGTWDVTSFTPPGGSPSDPAACAPADGGGYETFSMEMVMDELLRFNINSTFREFSDASCGTETGTGTDLLEGFVDQDGATLRLWMANVSDPTSSGMYLEFATTGTSPMTATRTTCLPMPDCAGDGPAELVFERR